jgi:hypothetical protein
MKDFLHHLFLPKITNNYRARVLHHKFLLGFIVFFFSAGVLMSYVRTNYPTVLGTFSDISTQQLLVITNEKRQENGVAPLSLNDSLSQAAANKAADMFSKNYWAHNAPDGTTPWVFIKGAGYNYIYAGENLARGFNNASEVVNAWMASPEHKKNMLSPNYQNVGFAVSTGNLSGEDTVLIVEMFGSTNFAPAPVAKATEKPATVNVVASGSPSAVAKTETKPETETLGDQKAKEAKPKEVAVNYTPQVKPLVDSQILSQVTLKVLLSMFIGVLLLDMIIIERKKVLRFVGHNLDHVFFFALMLLIVIILVRGSII